MNVALDELLASLALGALDVDEAALLAGRLATDSKLRDAYASHQAAAQYVALSALSTPSTLSAARKRRMLDRIVTLAQTSTSRPSTGYSRLVPHERLLPFAPGIEWAVVKGAAETIVFFVFDPAECTEVPLEVHAQRESGYVLEGDCTLWYLDGAPQRLKAGDFYDVPAGRAHGARFHVRTILLDVFAPRNNEVERRFDVQLRQEH